MRLIATEEAFAPPQYITEFLKLTASIDTAGSRYLGIYYRKAEAVRQLTDIDYRLAEMDAYGVDMHLLSITSPGVQAFDAGLGTELAILSNDMLAAAIKRHPARLSGLAAIAPQSPENAVTEINRAISSLGLKGLIINSHTHGEYLDDPKFWPIFEAAVAHDVPVYLHPAFPAASMIEPYSQYGMMGALWGFGADTSLHAVRMIMGGVFDALPNLKIVLGHLGESIPFWLDRLDNRYRNILHRGGLEPLGMKKLERLPSEYFASNFHITTSGMNTQAPLDFCLSVCGEDKIMWAIDYPYEQTEDAVPFIRNSPLPEATLRKLTHTNAERLFRIPSA